MLKGHKMLEDYDDVAQWIDALVPESLRQVVSSAVHPCINGKSIRCAEGDIGIGASKLCGRPDVPASFEWPMTPDGPCWFLGQLNLSECCGFHTGYKLPQQGILSFFYHDEGGPAGPESRIFLFQPDGLVRTEVVIDERWPHVHTDSLYPRALILSQGWALPNWDDLLSDDQKEEHGDLMFDLTWDFNDRFAEHDTHFFGVIGPTLSTGRLPAGHQLLASFGDDIEDRIIYSVPQAEVGVFTGAELYVDYECT